MHLEDRRTHAEIVLPDGRGATGGALMLMLENLGPSQPSPVIQQTVCKSPVQVRFATSYPILMSLDAIPDDWTGDPWPPSIETLEKLDQI